MRPDYPGYSRIDIVLHAIPTERFFDPEALHCETVSKDEEIEELQIRHPWSGSKSYRLCAGNVTLQDRRGKCVEVYSFGGELQLVPRSEQTLCVLTSPAPIFTLFPQDAIGILLMAEVEELLAQRRAEWETEHPHAFETRLTQADPYVLYVACLKTLESDLAHIPHTGEDSISRLMCFVRTELLTLRDSYALPLQVPSLVELL